MRDQPAPTAHSRILAGATRCTSRPARRRESARGWPQDADLSHGRSYERSILRASCEPLHAHARRQAGRWHAAAAIHLVVQSYIQQAFVQVAQWMREVIGDRAAWQRCARPVARCQTRAGSEAIRVVPEITRIHAAELDAEIGRSTVVGGI